MRVFAPSNDVTRASPVLERAVRSRSGSALGLSQPLSGFLAGSSSTALFHAAAVPGLLSPSERSPRLESRTPLRAASFLAVVHPRAKTHHSWLFSAVSSDSHARTRSRRPPPSPRHALSTHRSALPGRPGPRAVGTAPYRELRRLRSLVPPTSPFVPAWVAPPREPLLSWSSAPPETQPPSPRILRPAQTSRVWTRPRARRPGLATPQTSRPSEEERAALGARCELPQE
jgi:hypothetical protein